MKTKKNQTLISKCGRTLGYVTIMALVLVAFAGWRLHKWAQRPLELPTEATLEFHPGTTLLGLAERLEQLKLIDQPFMFHLWVRVFQDYSSFKAGLYRFEGSVTPQLIAAKIRNGEIHQPIVLQFTIPEGFTYRQFANRMVAKNTGTLKTFERLFADKDFLVSLEIPSPTLEGYIYPATYSFVRQLSPKEVIRFAVKTFWEKLPPGYQQAIAKKGLNLHQAVTFASLIEKETLHEDEKPKVAEVIWNRLKNREPLAIDASLIYGIKDYDGDIKWKHLKDKKNLFNSRVHQGLPPTPVASPTASSLKAVLNPTNEGYYYYVLDTETVDRHHFSKTLAEHNRYVERLRAATQKSRRARPK